MRILLFFLLIASTSSMAFAIPSRVADGVVQFAIADVSGRTAWTEAERDALIGVHGAGSVTNYTPASYEVNLSTCLVIIIDGKVEEGFTNYTEWISCQTKPGLRRKIRRIRQLIDSMSDLPASETADLRQRAGWIRSYYNTLP